MFIKGRKQSIFQASIKKGRKRKKKIKFSFCSLFQKVGALRWTPKIIQCSQFVGDWKVPKWLNEVSKIELVSLELQVDSVRTELSGKSSKITVFANNKASNTFRSSDPSLSVLWTTLQYYFPEKQSAQGYQWKDIFSCCRRLLDLSIK